MKPSREIADQNERIPISEDRPYHKSSQEEGNRTEACKSMVDPSHGQIEAGPIGYIPPAPSPGVAFSYLNGAGLILFGKVSL
jgi:hypothetical protein